MTGFDVGIRKYVENDKVQYWLMIKAKAAAPEGDEEGGKVKFTTRPLLNLYLQLIHSPYWKILIIFTVFMNVVIFISYFWLVTSEVTRFIVLMHLFCLLYWIDFLGAITENVIASKISATYNVRSPTFLVFDAISLVPLSTIYLIAVKDINIALLWQLRGITVIRFYRIPQYFSHLSTIQRNRWIILMVSCVSYMILIIISAANIFLYRYYEYSPITIYNWDDTTYNRIVVSLYFITQILFNVGYGDIEPKSYSQIGLSCALMAVGTAMNTGILSGILGIAFMSKEYNREHYRYEYEAIKKTLEERNISRKTTKEILNNMNMFWSYKRGYRGSPPINILPLSLRKEIQFDINFIHLNRSLIFSTQPRSFLRSVALFMKNLTYLPGEIIIEPSSMSDVMICVASGVIEVLSEENDESVLCSLTTGTIIGEATLFIPLPVKCIIRASTFVELQVLMKVNFARLALTYPDIFKKMRSDIFYRLQLKELDHRLPEAHSQTKNFLQNLRSTHKDDNISADEAAILSLYTLSENIPQVKTLPVDLIREKPWIFRPDTPLKTLWDWLTVFVIIFVAMSYPIWVAFHRTIDPLMYVALVVTKAYFIIDVTIECITAIERKDHFTFITSVGEIIACKLKTFGFYMDVLSMYTLSIYSSLVWPENPDYAYLLLSLNALLKTFRIITFAKKLENNMKNNLLLVVTMKYFLWIGFFMTWGAALLYVEAHPGETYIEDRWFNQLEIEVIQDKTHTPRSATPTAVAFYFATVTTFALGYGDIIPKAIPDCVVVILCIISGYTLVIACVSETSAAIKHLARIRTTYQEELFAVNRFMSEHDIPKDYRIRVRNYLAVQWNYDKGYSLKQISLREITPGLQRRIIMLELSKSFLSVPIFRDVNLGFLKLLSKLCKVRVLPPDEMVWSRDSFIRQMHIIEDGYCEFTRGDDRRIIGPLTPFGFVEMILGKQHQLTVKTLTHVRMVSLNYTTYLQAVTKYPEVKMEIEDRLNTTLGNDLDDIFAASSSSNTDADVNVTVQQKFLTDSFINVYKYHKTISIKYWEPFRCWGKCRVFQFFLLPIAIHPGSNFLKIWMAARILSALVIGTIAPIQFSLFRVSHLHMKIIIVLQVFAAVDMYLMFHVAYYDKRGLLMFHPSKTAVNYLTSNFILDLISVFPAYWILSHILDGEESTAKFLINSSGLIMILQLYKFFQACYYIERDIVRKTDVIKTIKLFPFVMIVINVITGLVILIQCYKMQISRAAELQGSTQLAKEFEESIQKFCLKTPDNITEEASVYKMYLVTLYWVTATITVCGFGDIWPHNEALMMFVIVIIVLGLFFFIFVFSSITSSMVNTNIRISQHRKNIVMMTRFMKMKNVAPELQERLTLHYQYYWQRTKGESPHDIFTFVNSGLREEIVRSMYRDTLNQNPAFKDWEELMVSIIGKHLEENYFLQGETIIKYKDILENIYLIYRGEVHLLNPKGGFIASMGRGGLFGNITNKSFSLSTETVLAAENVDLIKLDRKVFFIELQSLPNTKSFVSFLTSRKENYVKPIPRHEPQVNADRIMKLNIFRRPFIPVEHMSLQSSHIYHISRFSCKNSIFFIRYKPYSTFIILPETALHDRIEMCILIAAYISSIMTSYTFAFQDSSLLNIILLYVFDLFFLLQIFLELHKTYPDRFGECVVEMKKVRRRYLKSRKLFYDIASNIPLEIFVFTAPRRWWFKILTILRLNRILRIHFVFEIYDNMQKKLMANKIYLEIGWVLLMICLMIHSLACVWFIGVCPLGFQQDPTWVTILGLENRESWEHYIYSVYHVIIVTTSTGLQALPVYSTPEVILDIIYMITCRYVVVLLTAVMTATINADSYNLFLFQQKLMELKESFCRQNISAYQLDKMWNYLGSLWSSEFGKQVPEFLASLPYTLKCEVMNEMFGRHLSDSYIFSKADDTFLRQLAVCMKRFMYYPGTYIVQQGDIDYTMYFIHKGEVSVLTIHPELIETIHFILTEGDNFGTKQGLIIGKPHSFSYRAETNVEILSLTLSEWQFLLRYFPEEARKIYERLETLPE